MDRTPERLKKELEEELLLSSEDLRSHAWYHGRIPRQVPAPAQGHAPKATRSEPQFSQRALLQGGLWRLNVGPSLRRPWEELRSGIQSTFPQGR